MIFILIFIYNIIVLVYFYFVSVYVLHKFIKFYTRLCSYHLLSDYEYN